MIFIETPIFTKVITQLIPDDEYGQLQRELLLAPDTGVLIKGAGGLRKIRWKTKGTGKRAGIRVIYYLDLPDIFYMVFAFKKTDQEDLTSDQRKVLKELVQEWLS
uniref:RelE toxin of RelE / RelB toxin-antitoxin system n=1 Tax=Candidatus Kentrum sp. LPFa TaxID=2126335 RepID=A0A450WZM4_9GAMM|nr:MAG: RelE toxin of RelE / RelB toxin-antitoxin system [Candidatus Kentron sp. LPFa]VFK35274.1 MAG: RelE toxin of RelE / RelB toxin-antitoxin system [Candidatus Kentron sp. LPFa]